MTPPSRSEVEQKLASFEGCTPRLLTDRINIIEHELLNLVVRVAIDGSTAGAIRHEIRERFGELRELAGGATPQLVEWVRELSAEVERLHRAEAVKNMALQLGVDAFANNWAIDWDTLTRAIAYTGTDVDGGGN